MRFSRRLLITVIVFALMMTGLVLQPTAAVHAQGGDQCFGLKADDCALLQAAKTSQKITSFNMDYELTFDGSGPQGNESSLSVKGSGPFAFDTKGAGLTGLNAGARLEAILSGLMLQNTFTVSAKGPNNSVDSSGEVRIVNGMLYFQGDKSSGGKWKSVDLKAVLASAAFRRTGMNMQNPLAGLAMMNDVAKLATIPGFIKIERTADQTVGDQQVATFVYHFDLPTLFKSPEFVALAQQILAMRSNAPKLNAPQLKALSARLATAFGNTTFTITRLVGVTDKMPHGFGLDLALKVDPAMMALANGVTGSGAAATQEAAAQPITVKVHFLVKLTGINSTISVEAPTNATPADVSSLNAVGGTEGPSGSTAAATPAATEEK